MDKLCCQCFLNYLGYLIWPVDGLLQLSLSPQHHHETEWHTHTLHTRKHTPTGQYDYLSGRSPLVTDLLIEQTFFLPFNLCWYQSCWRIKWSLLELATIIKWQCDPRLRREGMCRRVLVCQSDSVRVSCVHTANAYAAVSEGVDHNVFICFSFDSVEQVLTTISKPWKDKLKELPSIKWAHFYQATWCLYYLWVTYVSYRSVMHLGKES